MTKFEILMNELKNTQNTERKNTLADFFSAYEKLAQDKKALVTALLQKGGHTFVSVETETDKYNDFNKDAKATHTSCICKSQMVASLNKIYENAVNNERKREEIEQEFVASPRNWGKRVSTEFVIHKGQIYITLYPQSTKATYFVDGVETDFDTYETMLQPSKTASYRASKVKEKQLTEKQIVYRDFNLESIKSIKINKNEIVTL